MLRDIKLYKLFCSPLIKDRETVNGRVCGKIKTG